MPILLILYIIFHNYITFLRELKCGVLCLVVAIFISNFESTAGDSLLISKEKAMELTKDYHARPFFVIDIRNRMQ